MAEETGFEPVRALTPYTISNRAPSTTRPLLHELKKIVTSFFI